MMVTTGARSSVSSTRSSSTSSSSASCCRLMNSTSLSNSFATSSITSASRRWLMDTIIPRLIHLLMTSVKLTSSRLASSLTEINSVTWITLLSLSASAAARFSAISSRLLRRYLALRFLPLPPPPASLACVSLILSWIALASTS
ncbi:hypothetical protein D3C87_1703960 [compost metagenome]